MHTLNYLEVTTTACVISENYPIPLYQDFAIYSNFDSLGGWSFVNCQKAKDVTCCLSLANMSQCQAATPKCSLNLPYAHNLRSATLQCGCAATIKIFLVKNNLNVWLKLPSNWFPSIKIFLREHAPDLPKDAAATGLCTPLATLPLNSYMVIAIQCWML